MPRDPKFGDEDAIWYWVRRLNEQLKALPPGAPWSTMDQAWVDSLEEYAGRVVFYAARASGESKDGATAYADQWSSEPSRALVRRFGVELPIDPGGFLTSHAAPEATAPAPAKGGGGGVLLFLLLLATSDRS